LEDLETIEIFVSFRHPHDLQKEKGAHATVLSQLESRFFQISKERFWEDQRIGEGSDFYPIMAWDLAIAEAIALPHTSCDLFGDMEEKQQESAFLLLSNQVADQSGTGFARFEMLSDFWPEDSFQCQEGVAVKIKEQSNSRIKQHEAQRSRGVRGLRSTKARRDEEATTCCKEIPQEQLPALMASAKARPLYVFKEPKALPIIENGLPATTQKKLLEIVSPKWWKNFDSSTPLDAGRRRYYTWVTAKGEALWTFQDAKGRWFWHGVFG
jgi:hypothetical protein